MRFGAPGPKPNAALLAAKVPTPGSLTPGTPGPTLRPPPGGSPASSVHPHPRSDFLTS